MTEVPQFRVFPDYSQICYIDPSDFPNGIPCTEIWALNDDEFIPKNFVFLVDIQKLCSSENMLVEDAFKCIYTGTVDTVGTHIPYIPFDQVIKVIDQHDRVLDLNLLKQSWIVNNHVFNIQKATLELNGSILHILIMGLQQALFIQPTEDHTLNTLFLDQACNLIKAISRDDPNIKEFFITGFPCEYMKSAREQLFSE